MSRRGSIWAATAALALGTAMVSLTALPTSAAPIPGPTTPTVTVVASGLNSPKHISFGPGGLYIVESGTGGPSGGNCVGGPGTTGGTTSYCEGPTASVALLSLFGLKTVLSGLPSVLEEDSQSAIGPAAVTFIRGHLAVLFEDELVNSDGSSSVPAPASSAFGKLFLTSPFSSSLSTVAANLAAFASANPQAPATLGGTQGETAYDSDPYDIVPYLGGYAIADAAGNDVLWLSPRAASRSSPSCQRWPSRCHRGCSAPQL